MKDAHLESQLVAATPHSDNTNKFVTDVMHKIKTQSLTVRLPAKQRKSFIGWVRHLHRPALVALAVAAAALLSTAVYASIQFAPALVKILGKDTAHNRTQYTVSNFDDCSKNDGKLNKFELNSQAPALSDDDVQKIIQAKCETQWVNDFASKTWPTYGDHQEWHDGDHVYYARPDIMGTFVSAQTDKATINFVDQPQNYTVQNGQQIKTYAEGQEVPLSQLKPGDTVVAVVRVQETYHPLDRNAPPVSSQPTPVGLIALVKMSLPEKYYRTMQQYITEVPECVGNPHEYCSNTPSVDVYPRGEGGNNPKADPKNTVFHEISGKVTALEPNALTLESTSGAHYTVTLSGPEFATYNSNYAPTYAQEGIDAELKIGTTLSVRYLQQPHDNPKTITQQQVVAIQLKLDSLNPKHDTNIKQY
jgi:hypothetical protein